MIARCPFCGSDDVKRIVRIGVSSFTMQGLHRLHQCKCSKCGASGPESTDSLEAERGWSEIPYLSSRLAELPNAIASAVADCVDYSWYRHTLSDALYEVTVSAKGAVESAIRQVRS